MNPLPCVLGALRGPPGAWADSGSEVVNDILYKITTSRSSITQTQYVSIARNVDAVEILKIQKALLSQRFTREGLRPLSASFMVVKYECYRVNQAYHVRAVVKEI